MSEKFHNQFEQERQTPIAIKQAQNDSGVSVEIDEIELRPEQTASLNVEIEKSADPQLTPSSNYYLFKCDDSPELKELIEKAEQFKSLPPKERVPKILKLTRQNLRFPFSEAISRETDEVKRAIKDKVWTPEGKLSDALKLGFGIMFSFFSFVWSFSPSS